MRFPAELTRKSLLSGLDLDRPVLEISPLFNPILTKERYNVYYCDVCSAEESREKHAGYQHEPIVDIDFVWPPGEDLRNVAPISDFNTVIASHVLEHVPNPVGWLNTVFGIMPVGGVIALVLPLKEYCFDVFRQDTTVAQMVDLWFRKPDNPVPYQIYDFLSNSVSDGFKNAVDDSPATSMLGCTKDYTIHQAMDFCRHVWYNNSYLDVHCSVFSPDTLPNYLEELVNLGLLNCKVVFCEASEAGVEFYVHLQKLGEPRYAFP